MTDIKKKKKKAKFLVVCAFRGQALSGSKKAAVLVEGALRGLLGSFPAAAHAREKYRLLLPLQLSVEPQTDERLSRFLLSVSELIFAFSHV